MAEGLDRGALAHNHIRFGWLMLAAFATVGIVLEALHAFKAGWYLEEAYATRRLMFTLGHAHGALLSIVNVLFGVVAAAIGGGPTRLVLASRLLSVATILLPAGFFIGGFGIRGGDPGVGVFLVPFGAACAVAAFVTAGLATKPVVAASETAGSAKAAVRRKPRRRGASARRR